VSTQVQAVESQRRRAGRRIPLYAQDWVSSESVKRWRSRVAEGTFPTFYSHLWRFLTHIHMTPDEAVTWAKANDPLTVLDTIQNYVLGLPAELRYKTKFNAYESPRSFFQKNRVILPVDKSFKIRSETPPVVRKITIENMRELIGLASQPLRSMLLCKWMSLCDTEGLMYISNHFAEQIVEAVKTGAEIVQFDMPGRKNFRNQQSYFTFIGHDALDSLKEYFNRTNHWPTAGEPVWSSEQTKQGVTKALFNQAWLALLRKAKLIPKPLGKRSTRYGFGVHNSRDLAISLLSTVPNLKEFVVEFWVGHDIDPNHYRDLHNLQPQFAMDQYRLAEPHLNILSHNPTETASPYLEEVIKSLEAKVLALEKARESDLLMAKESPVKSPSACSTQSC